MRRTSDSNGGGRGSVVGSRALASINNSALDTINAAANRIASVENRHSQEASAAAAASAQKKKWGGCWSIYSCFGYQRSRQRIGHAVFIPEPRTSGSGNQAPTVENPNHQQPPPQVVHPFMAPPSSPASFIPSEPPSVTQSPAGKVSLSMYSPPGPSSIFAIGPYAHETQLVSPPVFSTFNTEPSTAPFTPPPESVHLTNTPSSPEVPFAQLLERFPLSHYEFQQRYQFHPGSPAGQLISPRSGISGSGASSPFPEGDFPAAGFPFMEFRGGSSHQGSGALTPDSVRPAGSSSSNNFGLLDRQSSDLASSHRVFFELTAGARLTPREEPIAASSLRTALESIENGMLKENQQKEPVHGFETPVGETSNNGTPEKAPDAPTHFRHRTITFGCSNDFDFGSSGRGELDSIASHVIASHQGPAASSNFVLDRQSSDLGELPHLDGGREKNQVAYQRVFFEWTADDRLRYEEPKTQPASSVETAAECTESGSKPETEETLLHSEVIHVGETSSNGAADKAGKEKAEEGAPPTHCRHRTITLGCVKDFDFEEEEENPEGEGTQKPNNDGPEWWANGKQGEALENWSFFPVAQPGTVI
ncbi:unnamed protein product [Linum trigynum]|uniref:Hydroxyproline-rich glycoprotein family protein n=1 Tax=Linum trigynum TaxID=586398 RepID=A0AAV2DNZ4_9ROSI